MSLGAYGTIVSGFPISSHVIGQISMSRGAAVSVTTTCEPPPCGTKTSLCDAFLRDLVFDAGCTVACMCCLSTQGINCVYIVGCTLR
jgi:hypothetical protein